jgi:EmrB/QacA subfamily drug resistance transporter
VLGVAQLMVVLDTTIVNIALPSAQRSLHFSNESRQWVVTAYALAFGSLLLLGGRLSDRLGRKRTFIAGLIGFSLASGLGGIAQSFDLLVGARALQGAFAALLAPSALSLLTVTFTDGKERAKAFGVFGATAGAGGSLGLLLGGVLTESLSWRFCLYVNLVIAIPAATFAVRLLTNHAQVDPPRIDVPGVITAAFGAFALVFGFSNAATHGWTASLTIAALAASAISLSTFAVLEHKVAHPLLPLRIVLDRARGASYIALALSGAGMFSVFLFLTYYLQQNLGYSPVETGVAFLPMTAAIVLSATTTQIYLLSRLGPKLLVATGMALGAAAMFILTRLSLGSTYTGGVLPGLIIAGLALGAIVAPAISTAQTGVGADDAGVASATVNTSQQIGGSVGLALLSTIFASSVSGYISGHPAGRGIAAAAAVHGYAHTFWYSAGIFAVGLIATTTLYPGGQLQHRTRQAGNRPKRRRVRSALANYGFPGLD